MLALQVKKAGGHKFPGAQINHLPASAGVRGAEARKDSKTRWEGRARLAGSAGGLKEEADTRKSKVESM